MKKQSSSLWISIFLVLLSCSFTFNATGISWMWVDRLPVPVVLILMAFGGFGYFAYKQLQGTK